MSVFLLGVSMASSAGLGWLWWEERKESRQQHRYFFRKLDRMRSDNESLRLELLATTLRASDPTCMHEVEPDSRAVFSLPPRKEYRA